MCRSLSALAPIQLQALSRPLCYSEWTCTCFLLSSVQIKPQLRNEVSPVVRSSSPQAGFQRGRVSRYESHRDVVAALSVCTLSHKPKAMLRDHHSLRCLQCSKSPWTSNRCPWSGRHRDRGPKAQLNLLSLYILAKGCCSVDKSSSCPCAAPAFGQFSHGRNDSQWSLQSPIQPRVGNVPTKNRSLFRQWQKEGVVSHIEAGNFDEAAIAATGFSTALCESRSRREGDECRRNDDEEVRREKTNVFFGGGAVVNYK